ncbi:MAG: hypothetical protein GY711_26015 [bacterium]|nr:hypothetical protein [bacterium]
MPTLVELAGVTVPDGVQGKSLVPLIRGTGGWKSRRAFSERRQADFDREPEPEPDAVESLSIVDSGYRLIHNFERPEGVREYELYDHANDPLNANDIAAEHPERVEELAAKLAAWSKWAEASRVESGGQAPELTAEERELLQGMGYAGD